jgi:hypothetical protein
VDQQAFLSTVFDLIRRHPSITSPDGVKAAQVGNLLRRKHPDVDWTPLGYFKLGDVLSDLESQGLIRTGLDTKHALSVWLPSSDQPRPATVAPVSSAALRSPPFRPLRKDLWSAFVTGTPHDRSYLSRESGAIRLREGDPPSPAEQWAEIVPIGQETQQGWARQFLRDHHPAATGETTLAVEAPDWFRAFPAALSRENPVLLAAWNRQRSRHVQEHVEHWCETQRVPAELVFDHFPPRRPDRPAPPEPRANLRETLLGAISCMATEDLLEIRIPAKYLIGALRPDLLPRIATGQVSG